MTPPNRPLRPPFFGPSRRRRPNRADAPDGLTRMLQAEYTAPEEPGYWDGFEARILAAVRDATATTTGAFRAVPAVAVEWWHALARWAQPGLAAAAVALVIAGAVFVDARATVAASRTHSAFRDVLDAPLGDGLQAGDSVLGAGLARAGDDASDDPADQARARRARLVDELLSNGLVRRPHEPGTRAEPADESSAPRATDPEHIRHQQRDATFRDLLPEE